MAALQTSRRREWEPRFWAKVWRTATCWLWLGLATEKGYGLFEAYGGRSKAHRLSWYLSHGEIPLIGGQTACVCHKCDVPSCVNPDHLFLGTNIDNILDATVKGAYKRRELNKKQQRNKIYSS